jgi:flagellin-specific chaperone FliS
MTSNYRERIKKASPLMLVILGYDQAIQACRAGDASRAARVITLLRSALNFDRSNQALGIFKLYQWCLECIQRGDFEAASQVLSELRAAWVQLDHRLRQSSPAGLAADQE